MENPWNNVTPWTLEQIEPLNYLNCYPNWHLNLNEFHFWTKWTLELMKFLNQLSPLTTLEPNKPSNQYNPWINWTLIPTEHSNQFNPQTNLTLELIETLVQLYGIEHCNVKWLIHLRVQFVQGFNWFKSSIGSIVQLVQVFNLFKDTIVPMVELVQGLNSNEVGV